mgnify:FL=1
MSIKSYEFYHGSVISRIVEYGRLIKIQTFPSDSNSSFSINDNEIGIFIKYTEARISPWRFTFKKSHQKEIEYIKDLHKKTFIILVCNDDGFCCLSWKEYKQILDSSYDLFEWISCSRMRREKYTVKGTDGKLKHKIGPGSFPTKLFE